MRLGGVGVIQRVDLYIVISDRLPLMLLPRSRTSFRRCPSSVRGSTSTKVDGNVERALAKMTLTCHAAWWSIRRDRADSHSHRTGRYECTIVTTGGDIVIGGALWLKIWYY